MGKLCPKKILGFYQESFFLGGGRIISKKLFQKPRGFYGKKNFFGGGILICYLNFFFSFNNGFLSGKKNKKNLLKNHFLQEKGELLKELLRKFVKKLGGKLKIF